MKKICVVTGSRAEYGLLKPVLEKIKKSSKLKLQLIVTGTHLSTKFGCTVKDIIFDGFKIDYRVKILTKLDTSNSILKSLSFGLNNFADIFHKLKPDLLLILGDRTEILIAAITAMIYRTPIGHIHGGELTEGAYDDAIRHSITKMAHLHFVATDIYKKRVIQMGEQHNRVFNVGGLGVENIKKMNFLSKKNIEKKLKINFLDKNLLITFHPVTLEPKTTLFQINELMKALSHLKDTRLIFTMPNSDIESNEIFKKIIKFCKKNSNAKYFKSLGQNNYFSCIRYVDGVIGNSSSGLIEVPSFNKCTINIGNRQEGRIKADSVIDCKPNYESIKKAINKLYSKNFQKKLKISKNHYESNIDTSERIVKIIENKNSSILLKKKFLDLSFNYIRRGIEKI